MIRLVRNCFVPMPEVHGPVFETILEVADSLMTYRSRYLANLHLAAVLDILLTDETSPRSLAYQFVTLAEHVEQLPRIQSQMGLYGPATSGHVLVAFDSVSRHPDHRGGARFG